MLTILNIEKINNKEFDWHGNEWILYGTDGTIVEYTFCFIPKQAGRFDISKAIFVKLDRWMNQTGKYKVESPKGMCYLDGRQMDSWAAFVYEIADRGIIN